MRAPLPLLLSSPYLNLPAAYVDRLLTSPHNTPATELHTTAPTLLTAAPSASGFWGASGLKGLIPQVYVGLEAHLLAAAQPLEQCLCAPPIGRIPSIGHRI